MNKTEKEVSSLHLNTMFDSFSSSSFFFGNLSKRILLLFFLILNVFSHVILYTYLLVLVSNVYIALMRNFLFVSF